MGLEHYVYLILGRMCTKEEVDHIWNTMQDMNRDFDNWDALTCFETASKDNIFTVFDLDGKTKWPVVVFAFGDGRFWERERDEFFFYVVERFVYRRSDRYVHKDFVPLQNIPTPHDPRSGLLLIQDVG